MPTTPLSPKDLDALRGRFRGLSAVQRGALNRLIVPMPTRDRGKEDSRVVQYAQLLFGSIFSFVCTGADEVGGHDCTSEVASIDLDRFLERMLREPTSAPPHAFGELVHNRLAHYCGLVLPGGLGREALRIAVEQERAWQGRGSPAVRLFVEPLSPWAEPDLELHNVSMKLGTEFVRERATRAVEAGIRGILCAPVDVEYLRPRFPTFPANDPVRIFVDGAFDPKCSAPAGYTRTGSYEEAARFGADAIMVEATIWSRPDPMTDLFAIIDQVAAGRAAYEARRKSR